MATALKAVTSTELPVLEQIECPSCGQTTLDSKCLNVECGVAAEQSMPKGALVNGLSQPYAFTIRGSVD